MANSKWNEDLSPKSVNDVENALLERYHEAKSLYIQRRLESFMVDHVMGFDETSNQFEIPDIPSITNTASDSSAEDDTEARSVEEKHAKALTALETAAQGIHASLRTMRNTYQSVMSRRKELEQMVQDLEQDDDEDNNDEDDEIMMMMDVDDTDIEREKTELLEQRKRQLQEEYARLLKEKEERMKAISHSRKELASLQKEESKIIESGQDPTAFLEKIKELKEMKEFYDSLREVMEELGGVKILDAREDGESRHLFLTVSIYESHQVEFELEVYRQTLLKLVNAKWITDPVVTSVSVPCDDNDESTNVLQKEQFSLPLQPLDDLVQTAKTTMGPPHDLRFVVREVCARIKIVQSRANDIAVLRRRVLTKVVGNDQVVCSLNEGIVIVMRLYDQWVKVEQVVGVSGWDPSTTAKIQEVVSKRDESWTPDLVVNLVQKEVERLKSQDGLVLPKTPVLPTRRKEV